MKKFEVSFEVKADYVVEAETEEEAVEIASNWFYDYLPDIDVKEVKEQK